jgi:hypothetical protein
VITSSHSPSCFSECSDEDPVGAPKLPARLSRRRMNQRRWGLRHLLGSIVWMLAQNGGHPQWLHGSISTKPLSLRLNLLDQLTHHFPVEIWGHLLPARQGIELK